MYYIIIIIILLYSRVELSILEILFFGCGPW